MKNRKHKQRTETLKPIIYPDEEAYEVKFNYFDSDRNTWVYRRKEIVLTLEGKSHHELAANQVKQRFPSAEIVSVTYC